MAQVIEQAAALPDQLEQAATGVMILLVVAEMLGQLVDTGGQQRDLDFRRTCVAIVLGEALDDLRLGLWGQSHARPATSGRPSFTLNGGRAPGRAGRRAASAAR